MKNKKIVFLVVLVIVIILILAGMVFGNKKISYNLKKDINLTELEKNN